MQNARIEIDHCKRATIQEPLIGTDATFNTSVCQASSTISSLNKYLNVNSPLQIGGLKQYPNKKHLGVHEFSPHGKPFAGCIRNLMMNGQLYDFSQPLLQNNTDIKCKLLEDICRGKVTDATFNSSSGCSSHGNCDGSLYHPVCVCQPGWTGSMCSDRTIPTFFGNDSYIKYALSFKPNPYNMNLQLRFRTWEKMGVIFYISDHSNQKYGVLEILESRLSFRFKHKQPKKRRTQYHIVLCSYK